MAASRECRQGAGTLARCVAAGTVSDGMTPETHSAGSVKRQMYIR